MRVMVMSTTKLQTLTSAEENFLASLSTRKSVNNRKNASKLKLEKFTGCVSVVSTSIPGTTTQETIALNKNLNSSTPRNISNSMATQSIPTAIDKKNDKLEKSKKSTLRRHDITNIQEEQTNCRYCSKPVYKMEEIKAEGQIYHKACFRCNKCSKQLKVDNYQSHEGVLYCLVHFKLIFAPKFAECNETEEPCKPELIIRENQPAELPSDVFRASDKPNLGLEELQQLNVRSRFHIFEKAGHTDNRLVNVAMNGDDLIRGASITTKKKNLQEQGSRVIEEDFSNLARGSKNQGQDRVHESDIINESLTDNEKRRNIRTDLDDTINDLKTRFELGKGISKEERREERKQEIQNIRSRLFMGKQARIKEMYQQAVIESEHGKLSSRSKPDISIGIDARSLRERFERGEILKEKSIDESDSHSHSRKPGATYHEADIFECAISKKSRKVFLEMDADTVAKRETAAASDQSTKRRPCLPNLCNSSEPEEGISTFNTKQNNIDVIKCTEKPAEVLVQTSEISKKFKFFETYRPVENKKRIFRITPPREGVVNLPSPEMERKISLTKQSLSETHDLERSHMTSLMITKFRELENGLQPHIRHGCFRTIKHLTPPIEQKRKWDAGSDYDTDDGVDYVSSEDSNENAEDSVIYLDHQILREAQTTTRAKQLCARFENWQVDEIDRRVNDGPINANPIFASEDRTSEGTKVLRERFEKLKNGENNQPVRPHQQVNRFLLLRDINTITASSRNFANWQLIPYTFLL
ncbi:uncharacterized protein LOC119643708 isoform X2 [Glossina fuscipes]|uniref:Uncharacterized protein LOC119643708 isoform X2 n=1 Tax=Glossina fuscipes TaxID=7396 RepID=A0A9C5ZLP9_9MUSC|nr:uncharacterized protein LOC119643708 isoform X2 [Glossina fuscipes]